MRKSIRFFNIALFLLFTIYCSLKWPLYSLISIIAILLLIGIYDLLQKKHTILRNFPVIGHARYIFEMIAPEIHQYFIESDIDGRPISRNQRSYVYQRAKLQNQTHPFGSEINLSDPEYRWMQHSIYPVQKLEEPPRLLIGGPDCTKPYSASLFNISAMSFGALGKNAILALNKGAAAGGFYHNTGEGGISPYHLQGGDLVYEVGTGYFGCRDDDGGFSADKFKKAAEIPQVKMIEIKLSQGAKPGHGGVLPAEKNNEEIAEIRGVKPHTTVLSPPGHSAFHDARGLLEFVKNLRELSGGKPVGFKLCVGSKTEFEEICLQMKSTGIKPDFITVDGTEGGTGAAPIVFSNFVGMPWEKGLIFVVDTLVKHGLKKDVRVITATKIFTAFDILKALCLGADACNSARGMMLALGCIQAMSCNTNRCPAGVATNNPSLMHGLVVEEKWQRVRNYHGETLKEFLELLAAAGCTSPEQLNRSLILMHHGDEVKSYDQVYPLPA